MKIQIAEEKDIEKLVPAIQGLRQKLSKTEISETLPILFSEGYKIAFVGNEDSVFSFAGFRINTYLYSGKTLYVDDLFTVPEFRKNGYAQQIFSWLKDHAKKNKCEHFSLDSGFQRTDAYKFYLNQGFFVESLHFGRKVLEL